ncbi:hypothetical protein XAP3CFBP6996_018095 [Xanthomonas citri pv. fuscans CFBP 6996]|nr:hypothetical protein XAP3CFBP6996_018095 [Xanthomonas citri pv. fuscans CFBP 6996]SOO17676.1 hypothetical protein XFF6992_190002 [Xanthomonas citri pv. fuscans]SOO18694.1 hypothetical protein XFF6992_260002 [Xanthomonas citri pv. fuscans]SOO21800.1 hypothetical protein XFF6992_710116 [Xanthomonas citri pv. fuscans]SOO35886.1 hypothetical protein XFF6994_5990003 [Xanthomonas citri pv. fuscans]
MLELILFSWLFLRWEFLRQLVEAIEILVFHANILHIFGKLLICRWQLLVSGFQDMLILRATGIVFPRAPFFFHTHLHHLRLGKLRY